MGGEIVAVTVPDLTDRLDSECFEIGLSLAPCRSRLTKVVSELEALEEDPISGQTHVVVHATVALTLERTVIDLRCKDELFPTDASIEIDGGIEIGLRELDRRFRRTHPRDRRRKVGSVFERDVDRGLHFEIEIPGQRHVGERVDLQGRGGGQADGDEKRAASVIDDADPGLHVEFRLSEFLTSEEKFRCGGETDRQTILDRINDRQCQFEFGERRVIEAERRVECEVIPLHFEDRGLNLAVELKVGDPQNLTGCGIGRTSSSEIEKGVVDLGRRKDPGEIGDHHIGLAALHAGRIDRSTQTEIGGD